MPRSTWWPRRTVEIGLAGTALLALVACGATQAPNEVDASASPSAGVRELIDPQSGLYAMASRYGDLVWTAGHLPEGVPTSASMEDQVNQALDNLEATLEAAGAGFDTVIKANVYLADFAEWDQFNTAFLVRMDQYGLPPRTTVEVGELGFGYKVEIDMVAHRRGADGP